MAQTDFVDISIEVFNRFKITTSFHNRCNDNGFDKFITTLNILLMDTAEKHEVISQQPSREAV